ncbi:hypothetical protein [Cytobacillus firmus]
MKYKDLTNRSASNILVGTFQKTRVMRKEKNGSLLIYDSRMKF